MITTSLSLAHQRKNKQTSKNSAQISPYLKLTQTTVPTLKWSEVAQLCSTLCHPRDCNLQRSSVHGIFQAKLLEWVAISFSRGSSQPRDQTWVSHIVGRCFTIWATKRRRAETKRKREFNPEAWVKETSNTISFKKKIMKRQRNTTPMKEQAGNTEV